MTPTDVVYINPFRQPQRSMTDAMITVAVLCKERPVIPGFLIIPRIGLDKFLSGNPKSGSSAGCELRLKNWLPTTLANNLAEVFGLAEGTLVVETLGEQTGKTTGGEATVVIFKITHKDS